MGGYSFGDDSTLPFHGELPITAEGSGPFEGISDMQELMNGRSQCGKFIKLELINNTLIIRKAVRKEVFDLIATLINSGLTNMDMRGGGSLI